jgi:hypothetical protein
MRHRWSPRLRRVAAHLVTATDQHDDSWKAADGRGTGEGELHVEVLPAAHGHKSMSVHVPGPLAPCVDPLHRTGPAGLARLTDEQRDACVAAIARDSFCILPIKLPAELISRVDAYITNYCDAARADPSAMRSSGMFKPLVSGPSDYLQFNLVELDPVFREMLTFRPALQLCYDCFGPMFHLGQEKWTRKFAASDPHALDTGDPTGGIGWHSDGPHGFPEIDGRVPFHTLRFGYVLSDTTHEGQTGTLECFRGSHRLKAANAQAVGKAQNWPVSLNPRNFPGTDGDEGTDPSQYSEDHVVHNVSAGTIISFQNGETIPKAPRIKTSNGGNG